MIFFDIDATLFDQDYAEQKGAIDFLNEHRDILQFTEDEFVKLWNKLIHKHYQRYLAKELTFQEQRRERIKELFSYVNFELSDNLADVKFEIYLNAYKNNWKPFDDVIPCFNSLKCS